MERKDFAAKYPKLWNQLYNMPMEKGRTDKAFYAKAPTFLMNPKNTLDSFLDLFDNDRKRAKALRDFANITDSSIEAFFPNGAVIKRNANPNNLCPIETGYRLADWWHPDEYLHYIGMDLSVSKDGLGMASVHQEPRGGATSTPLYVVDFVLLFNPVEDNIDYELPRNIIRAMKRRGFKIGCVGYDQFQSFDMGKILEKEGFECKQVSFHENLSGATFVRDLVYDNSIDYPDDYELIGEMTELCLINSGRRVEHMGGHAAKQTGVGKFNRKDVWDALVNACALCASDKRVRFIRESLQA